MRAGNWGIAPTLMRIWYLTVIEKRLLYGASIWAQRLGFHARRHLQSTQRPFLLLITKAYRTTSTEALLVLAGLPPITLVAEKFSKITTFLHLGCDVDSFCRSDYEAMDNTIPCHPSLGAGSLLADASTSTTFNIFTDGSRSNAGVAAAFVVFRGNAAVDTWSRKLSHHNSVYQAELVAIREATRWLCDTGRGSGTVISDSEASIKAITGWKANSALVRSTQNIILASPFTILLKWTRAHVGTLGNEIADLLARKAVAASPDQVETIPVPLPWSLFKKGLDSDLLSKWQERWNISDKGRGLFPFVPRVNPIDMPFVDRLLIIFFSGHGPFPKHLLEHKLLENDQCVCGRVGTRLHYLWECPMTSQWHMPKPSQVHEEEWMSTLAGNKRAFIRIIGLMKYLIQHERELRAPT